VTILTGWSSAGRRRPPPRALGANLVPGPARRGERWFVTLATVGSLVLLAVPVGRLVQRSLTVRGHGIALTWYRTLWSSGAGTTRAVRPGAAFVTSLTTASWATLVATIVGTSGGVALNWIARRGRGRGSRVADVGLMLPLGASAVTIGLGLFVAFGRPPFDLRGSAVLIPLAHALVGIPFVVRAVAPTLGAIDPRMREAAATLGSSRWRTFWTIDAPLARRTLVVGAGMAFAVSLGEFGATSFLARRSGRTVPLVIADLLGRPGAANVGQAQALAVVLAVASAGAFLAADALSRSRPARGRSR
jgi:thiamine transport system permease protein